MKANNALTHASVRWLLVMIAGTLIPHFMRLPLWLSALLLVMVAWRYLAAERGWPLPGAMARFALVVSLLTGIVLQYGLSDSSVDIFATLLVTGTVLRSLEVRTRRAARNLVTLLLVVTAAGFIYGQSIPMAFHATAVILMALMVWQQLALAPGDDPGPGARLKAALYLLALAAPLMLLLFLTVPRIGPLWAMPAPDSAATTGVSDELSPGSISKLGMSDELAFRVAFDGAIPVSRELYWRGLALDRFDEGRWHRSRGSRRPIADGDVNTFPDEPGSVIDGSSRQTIIMEPADQRWIYTLAPLAADDRRLAMDRNLALYSDRLVTQRERFELGVAGPTDNLPGLVDGSDRRRALQMPESGEPRSRDLARQWRAQANSDRGLVDQALEWFRSRPFVYTLEPPLYGDDGGIDAFLFEGRSGFCGHYASAFAYLMRAAGIPSRVVVGYQGGELNPYENYLMVYQYNAHAWVEVWLEDTGWTRIDPTTVVSPDRVELGAEAWLQQYGEQAGINTPGSGPAWLHGLRMRLDRLEYAWSMGVINFDSETQLNLLELLTGQRSDYWLRWALGLGLAVLVTLSVVLILWSVRTGQSVTSQGRLLYAYHRLLVVAARRGAACSPTKGPLQSSAVMIKSWPRLSEDIQYVRNGVIDACYRGREDRQGTGRRLEHVRLRWVLYVLRWKLWLSRPRTCF